MWRVLARVEDCVAIMALVLFTAVIIAGVFFRYVLNHPLSWTEETSLIAFAWLLFLGAAICARENAHILIDLVAPKAGSGLDRVSEAFSAFVGIAISVVMAYFGFRYTLGAAPMVTPIFRVSSAVYNAAAPVGFALIALHLLRHAALSVAGQLPDVREERDV